MAKKKIPKQSKRRLTFLTPLVILAIGYCLFTLVTTVIQLYQLHSEEDSLQSELNDLKGQSNELKTEVNKLQDKDYVARYARENYLYTKDGEYVIKTHDEDKEKKEKKFSINEEYYWYGGVLVGFLFVFYLFVHHKRKKKVKKKKA